VTRSVRLAARQALLEQRSFFDPTFSGLPQWPSRMVDAFPVRALAQLLQGAYTVRPFPAWDLVNLGLWTAAGAGFVAWRFRWHS
jgi:hypothetical protein